MSETGGESYLSNLNEEFRRVDTEHFWYVGRRRAIESLLHFWTAARPDQPVRAVEIGSGTGGMLATLSSFSDSLTAIEPYPPAAEVARTRAPGVNVIQCDAREFLASRLASFELIAAFDVLEHIEDDQDVLNCFHAALVPGGAAVVSVPAMSVLWSSYDEFDLHFRRYNREDLVRKLVTAGFEVKKASYFFASLFPIVYFFRKVRDLLGCGAARQNADLKIPSHVLNAFLRFVVVLEAGLLKRVSLPFGSSLVCLAVKPLRGAP
jgi:2-polyprenyl-3-methyl-5-hydroxy-6-metoxy-1,4-benzoquinol methylase